MTYKLLLVASVLPVLIGSSAWGVASGLYEPHVGTDIAPKIDGLENIANSDDTIVLINGYDVSVADKSVFINNKAGTGGVFSITDMAGTELHIGAQTRFEGNVANKYGGAIYNASMLEFLPDVRLLNNDSAFGGAIANTGSVTGQNIWFYSNRSVIAEDASDAWHSRGGGAIYNDSGASIDFTKAGFYSNSTTDNGGAIYNSGMVNLTNVTMSRNVAGGKGGAIYNTDSGVVTLHGKNMLNGNRAMGTRNDIYNTGTVVIADGETSLGGGITGSTIVDKAEVRHGTFELSSGATLNMGTTTINQAQIKLDGTVNASISDAKDYVHLLADTLTFGPDAQMNLTVTTAGTYNIFAKNMTSDVTGFTNIDAGKMFTVKNNGKDGVVIRTVDIDTLASDNNISKSAATVLSGLANSGNKRLSLASANAQAALAQGSASDLAYIESESAKFIPEKTALAQSVAMSAQSQVLTLTSARMAGWNNGRSGGDLDKTGAAFWAQGLLNWTDLQDSFNGTTRGVAVGLDTMRNRSITAGVGYAYGDTDISANSRDIDIESNTLFVYAQYKPSRWFINGSGNYTKSQYSETQTAFGFYTSNEYNVRAYGAQLTSGYDFAFGLTPMAGARYLHVATDSYDNGLGRVDKADSNFVTGLMGAKYVFNIKTSDRVTLRPELRAMATYDIVSDASDVTLVMPGDSIYVVSGDGLSRMGGEFGVGVATLFRKVWLSINYDLTIRPDYTSHTGMMRARYEF